MSETKWHWDGDGNPWEDYNTKEQAPWIVDDDGSPVLSGEIHCRSESEARLLEAAPELYEALDLAVRQNSHDMLMTGEELRACALVLAKARGEA
ncbi:MULTISPECIES: hypothetical protein [Xanthomonas]|uniref:Uncharacterized protein n=2 Tax=Xanthomonas TaxID=338 RepID=A0A7Z7IYI9_XANCH|nr:MULTISPECIES: hypothetical protein [Xanthomonas]ATS39289.2 hypothetical protein XcfCFBP6988P_15105 [Xanthomonas citri pv. phaseoli var. fuscans]ATS41904.1 hypothetical protein XcfCFBP6989P_05385 [Xanthomonas citri pv. phaseoli var. fuscans]ATS47292.1 hypothetical protein XcfCFBP6990P_11975 [Xanthomonas citri pv. phaseoli var. fuscans]ATS86329.2 hypothetical protein XcfCFBP6991P_22255 [Xanthomonas citri pv. phaseoli var. fuscans]QWN20933.1 hypothetical protein DGM98_13040 [Xanthomonas citri]